MGCGKASTFATLHHASKTVNTVGREGDNRERNTDGETKPFSTTYYDSTNSDSRRGEDFD